MERLICDINLGGSTSQFLDYNDRCSTKEAFAENVAKALMHNAKTKPTKIARRFGCLIALSMIQVSRDGDENMLNCVIAGFELVEQRLIRSE
jgi:hypothetical protein